MSYANARHERKQDGVILLDGKDVGTTKQCCHCGGHFLSVKGSGKLRGYCPKCDAITCGDIKCCPCMPFEKKLDLYEKGELLTL